MKPSGRRRKCLHCKDLFLPDYRNAQRQRYCLKPECRQARKRAAQQAWLAKPANQAYFRDAQNAQRVRDWQKEHPGYWRHSARYQRRTLQDDCPTQVAVAQLSAAEPPVLKPPQAVPPPALVERPACGRGTASDPAAASGQCPFGGPGVTHGGGFSQPYLTRPLFDAYSHVCRADLHVHRQYLTRRHRHQRSVPVNQGARHSGHGARPDRGKLIA